MDSADEPNDINLDLIAMVQRARLLHDESARPSDLAAVYWIEVKRTDGEFPAVTATAGEWRIALTAKTVDALWARIKAATVAGELGYKSKASTAPAMGQADADARMICVRTYNAGDKADVERVRLALKALGADEMTYVAD